MLTDRWLRATVIVALTCVIGACAARNETEIRSSEPGEPRTWGRLEYREAGLPPPVMRFSSCSDMHSAGWTEGVAWDGGTYEMEWNRAERATAARNRHLLPESAQDVWPVSVCRW